MPALFGVLRRIHFALSYHIRFTRALDSVEDRRTFVRIKLLALQIAMCYPDLQKEVCNPVLLCHHFVCLCHRFVCEIVFGRVSLALRLSPVVAFLMLCAHSYGNTSVGLTLKWWKAWWTC